jgi:hypothetical protein
MRRPIQDEFTNLPVSRQRRYQLRKRRDNLCTECGAPAQGASRCLKHLVLARERQRERLGLRTRYRSTLSYRMEDAAVQSAKAKAKGKGAKKSGGKATSARRK